MTTRKLTARPVSLLEACSDRGLLGLDLSEKQRELLALVEDNGTTIVAAGRQGGKSLCGAAALVWNLLLRPDLDELTEGSTRHGLAVANSREQAQILLGYARRLIENSPLLRHRLVGEREDRLVLEGGRVLVAMPCSDRLMRGLVASIIVLDEFGHFLSETIGPAVADRVYSAVRPSLTTFGEEGRLLAISTPLGSDNLFATLHARARNGELPSAAAFTATTAELNPRVSAEFLASERVMLGQADYEREYEAAFGAGSGQFFEDDAVRAVVGRYRELPPDEIVTAVVGFDPSFSVDPSAAAVVGRSSADHSQLVVARVERWLPTKTRRRRFRQSTGERQEVVDSVLDRVAAIATQYGAPVVTDQHVPATVIEGLRRRGVSRVDVRAWTAQSQTDAFRALRSFVYTGRITLPDDDQLVSELLRLRTKLRAGSSQVEVPRTGADHCDSAVALAAGVAELDRYGSGLDLDASVGDGGFLPLREALAGSRDVYDGSGRIDSSLSIDTQF